MSGLFESSFLSLIKSSIVSPDVLTIFTALPNYPPMGAGSDLASMFSAFFLRFGNLL